MLRVLKCDRAAKTVEFGEPCMGACSYSCDEYARLHLATNLHALTLGLAGWRVNGVRIGDTGITSDYLQQARANISREFMSQK